jgi:hypothetical protein
MAATSKVYQLGKAPKRIQLFGDQKRQAESAQHVIEFPGGAIELTRTEDGDYWAHIVVNRNEVIEEADGLVSALGEITDSRIDSSTGVIDVPNYENVTQVALRIRSVS